MSYANDSSLPLISTGTLYRKLLRITLFHQVDRKENHIGSTEGILRLDYLISANRFVNS